METDRLVERTISSMQPGEHACCICAGDEPFRAVLLRYISAGLAAGQKIVSLYNSHTPKELTDFLLASGVDTGPALTSGQLVFLPCLSVFGLPERFDPNSALAAIRTLADQSIYKGYPAMRLVVEMSWAAKFLPGSPGAGRLVDFEIALNQPGSIPNHILLCVYDRSIFPSGLLPDALSVHPYTWNGSALAHNNLYTSPALYQARQREKSHFEQRSKGQTGPLTQAESGEPARYLPGWGKRAHQNIESLASAQAALLESEKRYKTIFDNSTDGIIIHDLEGRILEVNSVLCQRLSYTAGELLGKTPEFLDVPELAGQVPVRLNLLQRYGALSFETVHLTRLGEMIPVEINARMINYGGRSAVLSIARDITDRKRAEVAQLNANQALATANEALAEANQALEEANAALRQSEQKFRMLIESSPDGVYLVDETGRIIEFNQADELIYGIPAAKMLGRPAADFFYESQPAELRQEYRYAAIQHLIKEAVETGRADWLDHITEREISRPDGHRRFIQAIGFPIHTDRGYMIGVITRDVTDHRLAEVELEQYRQHLETMVADRTAQLQHEIKVRQQAEENLEVMLREIHHRVKNNLNVIIALIDLQKTAHTDPQVLQVFKELQTRAYTMALVHESLYRSPNLAQVDFSGYLHTLVAYLNTAYGPAGHGVPVRLHVEAENISLKIETAIPCGLIVNELVTNALKYAFPPEKSHQENEIIVSLSSAGAGAERDYVLSVRDNGVGLPPEMNWKAAATLGLQLVQVLTRQLGGRISLDAAYPGAAFRGAAWRLEFSDR